MDVADGPFIPPSLGSVKIILIEVLAEPADTFWFARRKLPFQRGSKIPTWLLQVQR